MCYIFDLHLISHQLYAQLRFQEVFIYYFLYFEILFMYEFYKLFVSFNFVHRPSGSFKIIRPHICIYMVYHIKYVLKSRLDQENKEPHTHRSLAPSNHQEQDVLGMCGKRPHLKHRPAASPENQERCSSDVQEGLLVPPEPH